MTEFLDQVRATEIVSFENAVQSFARSPEANLQTYEYLSGTPEWRAQQKKNFLEDVNNISNPALDMSPITWDELRRKSYRMQRIMGAIEQNVEVAGANETAFYELGAERSASIYFLLQAKRLNDMPVESPHFMNEAVYLAQIISELYGVPNGEDFFAVVKQERGLAEEVLLNNSDPFVRQIARELLNLMPEVQGKTANLYNPTTQTVEHYHSLIKDIYGGLLEASITAEQDKYEPVVMAEVFQRGLEYLGAEEWHAEIKEGGTNAETSQEDKKVYVGSKRQPANAETMKQLVVHELGVHVLRRLMGEKTDNPLLWNTGLSGYYTNEEGLGVVVEEALTKNIETRGAQHYLNIGLTLGLDGHPRDFRQVFEIEWRRRILNSVQLGKTIDAAAIDESRGVAYNNIVRIRRGTPAHIPGIAFTKDLAYFNGRNAIWKYFEQKMLSPDEYRSILTGKHDPIRTDHRAIVEAASITT